MLALIRYFDGADQILLLLVAFDTSSEPDARPLDLTREDVFVINSSYQCRTATGRTTC